MSLRKVAAEPAGTRIEERIESCLGVVVVDLWGELLEVRLDRAGLRAADPRIVDKGVLRAIRAAEQRAAQIVDEHVRRGSPLPGATGMATRVAWMRHDRRMIRLILNILWLIFGSGILLALAYALAGIICFLLIVTIPFGVAAFRLANYSLWPFGRTLVTDPDVGAVTGVANVLWVVLAGWWLALSHIVTGVAQCLTIIGIPFGIANFKLVPAAFWPLGRTITDLP